MQQQKIVAVLLPTPFEAFDYVTCSEDVTVGEWVQVSFRHRGMIGVVVGIKVKSDVPLEKLKEIQAFLPFPPLQEAFLTYIQRVSAYTLSPMGSVFKMVGLPSKEFSKLADQFGPRCPSSEGHKRSAFFKEAITLTSPQSLIAQDYAKAILQQEFQPFLLEGITGSGKTEVYLKGVAHALEAGKNVLILLPEISLAKGWCVRFEKYFNFSPTVWHSGLTPKQKREAFREILLGTAHVVVGARSALFLPLNNIGLVIVDEEHEGSYKQDSTVLYNARDMAVMRAQQEKCPLILSSATPSLETLNNVAMGRYHHHHLTERFGEATLPKIDIIDMNQQNLEKGQVISEALLAGIKKHVDNGQQAFVFLNRRGYAPTLFCPKCQTVKECPKCHVSVVYHKHNNKALCHHCGYEETYKKHCSGCQEETDWIHFGAGVEKVAEELEKRLPGKVVRVLSSDTLTTDAKLKENLDAIQNGEVDVIVGTQTMAKGHHFPNLTFVGILNADPDQTPYDLRANEKLFQTLHQVAGRAGRAHLKGEVCIQSYQPHHPILRAVYDMDHERFVAAELEMRRKMGLPPHGHLTALLISAKTEKAAADMAHALSRSFYGLSDQQGIQLLGPTPAPIAKVNTWYRWRILLKSKREQRHQGLLQRWLAGIVVPRDVKLQVDVDPHFFA